VTAQPGCGAKQGGGLTELKDRGGGGFGQPRSDATRCKLTGFSARPRSPPVGSALRAPAQAGQPGGLPYIATLDGYFKRVRTST
jgi:hypothetical protein